jgi:molybdopterin synthase catalytic subunit
MSDTLFAKANPPLEGGFAEKAVVNADIRIQQSDFDAGAEIATLAKGGVGAVASFVGVVRGSDGVTAMTLEHYPGMTEREIARHVAEAQARWPLLGVTVIHRIGKLAVGGNIVLVAAASAHREAAFSACEFLVDYLKTRAPFWKLEERGGNADWVSTRAEDEDAVKRWERG